MLNTDHEKEALTAAANEIPFSTVHAFLWRVVAIFIITTMVVAIPDGSTKAGQTFEENIDRPGSDFSNFDLDPPVPGSFGGPVDTCRTSCERDGNCKAWTFVRAGVQGPKDRCWLKTQIPAAVQNNCCTSGVPMRELELTIDRPGADYKNFDLTANDPNLCKSVCQSEGSQCKAWTFVRAGVQGPSARCWLKNSVPPAFTNDCCTSGVKPPFVH